VGAKLFPYDQEMHALGSKAFMLEMKKVYHEIANITYSYVPLDKLVLQELLENYGEHVLTINSCR